MQTMERYDAISNSPRHSLLSPSSTAVRFCSTCDKPFTNEISRDRHTRYCGSRTRNRPRSCLACNASKAKCSFEAPCSRCAKKGIECVYNTLASRRKLPRLSGETHETGIGSQNGSSDLIPETGALHGHDGASYNVDFTFVNSLTTNERQTQFGSGKDFPSLDLISQDPSLDEFLALDGFFASEEIDVDHHKNPVEFSMASYDKLDAWSQSWCGWIHRGATLSAVTENTMLEPKSHQRMAPQLERPLAQHNADLVIQSLRAFPTMMLRRETFPWYMHKHSHLMSPSTEATLPEALSNCMSIAQMFALRTPETKAFLWRTIRSEHRRLSTEKHQMSKFDLLAAVQACMIYLIMCIIDESFENEKNSPELLLALHELYLFFKQGYVQRVADSQSSNCTWNWKEWVFEESQRRIAHLWFLVGCVVCIKSGNVFDTAQSYRNLQLPCSKSLWEASTQIAWESEREATRTFQMSGLITLGDLIDAQRSEYAPANANKMDSWNAGADNLGTLLNLVNAMV